MVSAQQPHRRGLRVAAATSSASPRRRRGPSWSSTCAYAEFADEDLSAPALELPNAVVLRTFSKAYGCAGLRVGYALGSRSVIEALRAAGNPYPCAGPSLEAAAQRLAGDIEPFVRAVRREREELVEALQGLGFEASPSQGNFVYAQGQRAGLVAQLLTGFGIAVRFFPGPGDRAALRITCPGQAAQQARLLEALKTVAAPEAILFDMDGVLVDVSRSYRAAIVQTAAALGVTVTDQDIEALKAEGNANDDWSLTHRLVGAAGVDATLTDVTARFEELYQGGNGEPGLKDTEALLFGRDALARLGQRFRLGIVTGRPRSDADFFLESKGIADLFDVVVTRDDAALKPRPRADGPRAHAASAFARAWLLGDTRDDVQSARAAGVLRIGVLAPGCDADTFRTDPHGAAVRSGAGVCLDRSRPTRSCSRDRHPAHRPRPAAPPTAAATTEETSVRATLNLDGSGPRRASPPACGFLDHMLDALARHARLDLDAEVRGGPGRRRPPHRGGLRHRPRRRPR